VEKIAALAVEVAGHTRSERPEQAVVELGLLVERTAVQTLKRPEVDMECIVASKGAAEAGAGAGTAPVVRVAAVAVAVAAAADVADVVAAVAVAAIESFVSHHSHNSRTEQTARAEGAVVRELALGQAQTAIVDYTSAAAEFEPLPPL
jgi:hypothetical protein